MSSSAQLDPMATQGLFVEGPGSAADLKQFAAERLAAHRRRHALEGSAMDVAFMAHASAALDARVPGASRVREAVAARYRQSLSYQEYLTAQAEQTMQQARAQAEIAERNAQAVEAAQTELLEDLRQWRQTAPDPESPALRLMQRLQEEIETHPVVAQNEAQTVPVAAIAEAVAAASVAASEPPASAHWLDAEEQEELHTLDQEIAFRLDPEFAEHHIQPLPLPANLLEFPRQLVATRKARPRLAEGPLRDDAEPGSQLRIFEVDTEQIATAFTSPGSETFADAPQWQSQPLDAVAHAHHEQIFDTSLDADLPESDTLHTAAPARAPYDPAQSAIYTQPVLNAPLHTAAISRRMLAAAVDACCQLAAAIGFACLAVVVAGPSLLAMPRPLLAALVGASALALYVVYHLLFFTFADATPGMRYAHLDFCTFTNENPTRAALRRRIWTTLVAALPLGVGLLWMVVDYDHAGWHDRMSKMYPREY